MQFIMRLHRLSARANRLSLFRVQRLIDGIIRVVFGAAIPGCAKIGSDVTFGHSGLGVVINENSIIGDRCLLGVHVVLGGDGVSQGAPSLGNDVQVLAGALVIGKVHIGDGAVVAAGSVVLADVPPRVLVAGIPAVIKKHLEPVS
jgi:serine O-acetyltransferase